MAYFADLSPYAYSKWAQTPGLINVGWLDRGHSFPTAEPDVELLNRLGALCMRPALQHRGYHICNLCTDVSRSQYVTEHHSKRLFLGSAEIRVVGEQGITYAAPTLIFHYVRDHAYRPPEEFLRALGVSLTNDQRRTTND